MHYKQIDFEKAFSRERMKSEQVRARLFFYLILILLTDLVFVIILYSDEVKEVIGTVVPLYHILAVLLFMGIREFNVTWLLKRAIRQHKQLSVKVQYASVFIEITIPTMLLFVLSIYMETTVILSSPVVFMYFLIISLTTLSLNFGISLFTGIVAGTEYMVLVAIWVIGNEELYKQGLLGLPYIYYGKTAMLVGAGLIAGFVGSQLRKRIADTYKTIAEKDAVTNLFGQQVSKEIVDELLNREEEISAKRLFVCVMFLDIRGFTPFAEKLEPEEIIRYQNEVFGFMIDEIIKNHGIINQFLGDGYMATFGAPVSSGNDCINAYNAAREIVKLVNEKSANGEIPKTRIGIGLHAGYVVAGNVGTDKRKQYSISGNTVILAARIEQLNKTYKSQLLISEEVLSNIEAKETELENLGEVSVKGREKPVNIYKVF